MEQLLVNPQLAHQGGSVLLRLTFAVCDRRLDEVRPMLALLVRCWLRTYAGDTAVLQEFMGEWLSLAARMARRRWREETAFLLREAGRWLLKQQDLQRWAWSLQQLQLHFVVYARWDGFDKACRIYRELTLLYRLLLRRVPKAQPARQTALLQLLLRHLRDVTANVSRSAMLDDADIFRQWYSFFWQLTADDKSAREELLRLLQLIFSGTSKLAERCEITVSAGNNSITLEGIVDTGNSVEDIFGGGEVIIADGEYVKTLFGEIDPALNREIRSRYRVMPCGTVTGGGTLEAFRCDTALVSDGKRSVRLNKPTLAVSKTPLKDDYAAIVNPRIFM